MDKLEQARLEINDIDREMAELFARRMKATKSIAEYKKERGLPIYDASRESVVIQRNAENIKDYAIRSYFVKFLQEEMAISKQYQESIIKGVKVAYSGIEGAYANIAARRIFPYGRIASYPDFKAAYNAVENGECDCCVLPIENSYAGEVGAVMDLMFAGDLHVNGIYTLKIAHCLLGVKGAKISDIKTVTAHPQALSQCAEYIKKKGFKTKDATNNALAAKAVFENGDPSVAAIASDENARLYGLEIIDHDINDSDINSTRFAVFSRAENTAANTDGKFLLMFSVKNEPGTLAKAINIIADFGFNMKVLRSRPVKNEAWQYYFYIEAEGDDTGENGRKMLEAIAEHCTKLKVAGRCKDEILLRKDGE